MQYIYKVWWIPTIAGMTSFGWEPRFVAEFDHKDDADLCAYEYDVDEPAPDKHDYGRYHVIKTRKR